MRLADYLSANKISKGQFALLLGTSQAAVSRYVGGKRIPQREQLKKIFDVTSGQVTPNDFVGVDPTASHSSQHRSTSSEAA